MARFITDLGHSATFRNEVNGEITTIDRYAVWDSTAAYRKAEVLEIGGDLEALQALYGPNLPIYGLGQGSTPPPRP